MSSGPTRGVEVRGGRRSDKGGMSVGTERIDVERGLDRSPWDGGVFLNRQNIEFGDTLDEGEVVLRVNRRV